MNLINGTFDAPLCLQSRQTTAAVEDHRAQEGGWKIQTNRAARIKISRKRGTKQERESGKISKMKRKRKQTDAREGRK